MGKKNNQDGIDFDAWNDSLGGGRRWKNSFSPNVSATENLSAFAKNRGKILISLGVVLVILGGFLAFRSVMLNSAVNNAVQNYPVNSNVKYDELGALVVQNYYSGLPLPVPVSDQVKGRSPGGYPDEDETDAEDLQGMEPVGDENVVTGVAFLNGEQTDVKLGSKDKVTDNTDFSKSYSEVLNYHMYLNGQPMAVSIQLVTPSRSSNSLPILLSDPTDGPWKVSEEAQSIDDNPAKKSNSWSDAKINQDSAMQVIERWADAWAQNDQSLLQQYTQDPKGRKYVGLGGWKLEGTPEIVWAASRNDDKDHAVVRVSFQISSTVVPKDSGKDDDDDKGSSQTETTTYESMDLLLAKAETSLPAIVAWGPAGSYDSLKEFGNGTSGTLGESPTEAPDANDSSSSSSSGSDDDADVGSLKVDDDDEDSGSSSSSSSSSSSPSDSGSSSSSSSSDDNGDDDSSGALTSEDCQRMGFTC